MESVRYGGLGGRVWAEVIYVVECGVGWSRW